MFAFDQWGDWTQERTAALARDGTAAVFKDGRQIPALASNPSYVVEITTASRLGYIGFWSNGLCDIVVLDANSMADVDNASMLEATDQTVPRLFERFLMACGLGPTANGS